MNQITNTASFALLVEEAGLDPIEQRLRTNIRATIEAAFQEEPASFLDCLRYGRCDGTPIILIRTNGRFWKENCPAARARNETLRATRYYGRALWKRWSGYHAQPPD
ncbi:hypothetical protein SAMN05444398_11611 [Roseovarius pacificus]|uniref:Uncharacterized protein n=1 Tax=Roseovarius pacificus TaxID=337701 RepID=A0A1M7INB1_9RHOB|nr:hypothetical protein GCM10011315_38400 [Roseovarius pacificus]SHM42165.1 hypothetical protein SAMN05444398_11611 [Roseovarius pacificus]